MIKACLLGKKLNYSLSPVIHKRLFEITGIEGSYDLCETDEDRLDAVMKELGKLSGANVTIPYKTAVMRYLDEISPEAEAIGAVNTISFKGGKAAGFNTDYYGLKDTMEYHGISLSGKRVAILGTGGASKCAVKLAADLKASEVITVSRSAKQGSISYEELEQKDGIDVLINTTPVGMYPDIFGSPVSENVVEKCGYVVDIVYNPLNTQLLRTAQDLGKKTAGGLRMLTSQAVKAQEIWNDKNFGRDVYDDVYDYVKNLKTNIVIIGMPGSGKSTIGRLAAERLHKNFVDTDELIEVQHGAITKIFAEEGEAAFREYERKSCAAGFGDQGSRYCNGRRNNIR